MLISFFLFPPFHSPRAHTYKQYTGAPDTQALEAVVHARFLPNAVLLHHDPSAPPESEEILPEVRGIEENGGRKVWFVNSAR
jgi:hypothetical protein